MFVTRLNKKSLQKALSNYASELAQEIFSVSQENLTQRKWDVMTSHGMITTTITDTSELLMSGEVVKTKDGAKIVYTADHASKIEYGAPPGEKVDPIKIKEWIRRKIGAADNINQFASNIVMKIYEEGTQPRPFLRNALDHVVARRHG